MCLILYKPDPKAVVKPDYIANSIRNGRNDDGAGVMFVADGRVRVRKMTGVMVTKEASNVEGLIEFCKPFNKLDRYIMHHRLTTNGENNYENTHPFEVLSKDQGHPFDLFMMHNGVISKGDCNDHKDGKSDTNHFVTDFLKPLLTVNPQMIYMKPFQEFIKEFINMSKLSFLDSENNVILINEKLGSWKEGAWYSSISAIENYRDTTYNYQYNNYRGGRVWDPHTKSYKETDEEKKKESTTGTSTTTTSTPNLPVLSSGRMTTTGTTTTSMKDGDSANVVEVPPFDPNPYEGFTVEEVIDMLLYSQGNYQDIQDFVLHTDCFLVTDVLDNLLHQVYDQTVKNCTTGKILEGKATTA